MPSTALQPGHFYHIYNRGNNGENVFIEEQNYRYFLQLYTRYIHPVTDTFAYCLLRNHFHFLVRIRTAHRIEETSQVSETCEVLTSRNVSQHFSNLFNAYAKAINKSYGRTGSLFEERFERLEVYTNDHFIRLIHYIHFNPQKHRFVADFREWPWTSYHALASPGKTNLNRSEVIDWFGDETNFVSMHHNKVDEVAIRALVANDLD